MASAKKFGGVKGHASPEQRTRMTDADQLRAAIEQRIVVIANEIRGTVNEILGEENRGREEPDDRDQPEVITDDGLA